MRGDLARAAEALVAGLPVVIPTDTVYGIAARPDIDGAVDAVFAAKGRPADKALPVLAARLADLEEVAVIDETARRFAARYWPGPLTLVLERKDTWAYRLGGRDEHTVAVRVPACAIASELLASTGPLAVTSANRSGEPSATTIGAARRALGGAVNVYIDAGRLDGAPSTVLSLTGEPRVLRRGAIPEPELLEVDGTR